MFRDAKENSMDKGQKLCNANLPSVHSDVRGRLMNTHYQQPYNAAAPEEDGFFFEDEIDR
jgi:hypothetical protein